MSVSSQAPFCQYTVTVLSQTLTVTFPFAQASDLAVVDGAVTCLLGGDYTVTGGGYNAANQMQTGSITIVSDTAPGAANIQIGDIISISLNVTANQTTSFISTGLMTPAMIEQDDDKLTQLIKQDRQGEYNPFPAAGAIMSTSLGTQIISGTTGAIYLGWITAQTGGIKTSIDSLNIVGISTLNLPLLIQTTISYTGGGYVLQTWMLRPMQIGDPSSSVAGAFIVPVTNPNSLIWQAVL